MSQRPYTRCQGCGTKYPAPRAASQCRECREGQEHFWPIPYAPEGFVPLPRSSVRTARACRP
jgi:hypothetical protein